MARTPFFASLLLSFLLPVASIAADARRPFSAEDLVRLERVSDPVLAPDGRTLAFTVRETDLESNRGRQDIWSLDLSTRGAAPRRLTTHPENDSAARWSADGRHLYFLSARGGSTQVWRLPLAGGEAEQVTDLPLDVGSYRLAPGGAHLAVTLEVFPDCEDLACTRSRLDERSKSKESGRVHERLFARHWDTWKDGRLSRLFVLKLDEGRASAPLAVSGALDADVPSKPYGDAKEYTFSPGGTSIVFTARLKEKSEPWSTNFDLYEVDLEGGEPRNLTAGNLAWDTQPVFSPDGRYLAWRAMERAGFEADRFHIVIADSRSGERRALTAGWDRSIDDFAFAPDGRTIYATAYHFGQHPLWSIDVKTGKPTMLTGPGRVDGFAVGEREVVFTLSSLKSPAELHALTARNGDLRELPRMNADHLSTLTLGEAEQFTFAGAGNETVYGYVVRPAGFRAGQRYPVAFIVHGGPQSSYANSWNYRWNPQTYAGAGYAVVFIDFHGSSGYGQAFTDSVSRDWGGKPLEDLRLGLAAALERYGWLDETRMCALGASYGGYMMNWMAGNWPEPFRCFVNHAGIFDNRFMGYSTEELWFTEWDFGGMPYEVPEQYEQHNPLNHVSEWSKPMLLLHGQLDFRVPYTQSIAAFTALQRRGIPSRLVTFPDENHWISKPANSLQWHREVLRWLGRWTGRE